jgi:hypothetical protein
MVLVPEKDAAEVFRLFHAIPKARISRDLADAADNFQKYWDRMMSVFDLTKDAYTPEIYAENLHSAMLCAFAANAVSDKPNDIAYHLAGVSARGAAQVAIQAAGKMGELGRLNAEIDRQAQEYGFAAGDDSVKPEGFERLREQAEVIVSRIEKMMIGDVMRRYRLDRIADEFENDESTFDARVRAGHELIYRKLGRRVRKDSA